MLLYPADELSHLKTVRLHLTINVIKDVTVSMEICFVLLLYIYSFFKNKQLSGSVAACVGRVCEMVGSSYELSLFLLHFIVCDERGCFQPIYVSH